MQMRFLKSGFVPFLLVYAIMISYFYLSNYKIGGDVYGELTIFNILFSILFLISICVAAFFYGKNKNKSGLIGLICAFVLIFVSPFTIMTQLDLPSFFMIFYFLFFFFNTSFPLPYPINISAPIVIILLVYISWFFGKQMNKMGNGNRSD